MIHKNYSKGFSLVELLAVIILLSLIMIVTIPTIINKYNEKKDEQYEQYVSGIENAARLYTERHLEMIDTINATGIQIGIDDLIAEEFLNAKMKNPSTNEYINSNDYVLVKLENNKIKYIYTIQGGE